jgi:hypothetical protein
MRAEDQGTQHVAIEAGRHRFPRSPTASFRVKKSRSGGSVRWRRRKTRGMGQSGARSSRGCLIHGRRTDGRRDALAVGESGLHALPVQPTASAQTHSRRDTGSCLDWTRRVMPGKACRLWAHQLVLSRPSEAWHCGRPIPCDGLRHCWGRVAARAFVTASAAFWGCPGHASERLGRWTR